MNQKKSLEILVVEDNPIFMQQARETIQQQIDAGANLVVHYATNSQEAMNKLNEQTYDAIMTDVFIPESDNQQGTLETLRECDSVLKFRESSRFDEDRGFIQKLEAADSGSLKEIYLNIFGDQELSIGDVEKLDLLKKFYQKDFGDDLDPQSRMYLEYLDWVEGKTEAPLGVLVSQYAFEHGIPHAMVTSTFHHGKKTQPVCEYARSKDMELIDVYTGNNDEQATTKDFEGALLTVAFLYEAKQRGLIEVNANGYQVTDKAKEIESDLPREILREDLLGDIRKAFGLGNCLKRMKNPEGLDEFNKKRYQKFKNMVETSPLSGDVISTVLTKYLPSVGF